MYVYVICKDAPQHIHIRRDMYNSEIKLFLRNF